MLSRVFLNYYVTSKISDKTKKLLLNHSYLFVYWDTQCVCTVHTYIHTRNLWRINVRWRLPPHFIL